MAHLRLAAVAFLVTFVALVAWSRRLEPDVDAENERTPASDGDGPEANRGRYDLTGRSDGISIVLISLDSLRFDHTGLGENARGLTPNLDQFADTAVVFQDAVTPAPWTLPAHMSIWTGLWPSSHGITNKLRGKPDGGWEDAVLPADVPTFPELLVNAGWRAAAFTGGSGVLGGYGFSRAFEVYEDSARFGGLERSVPAALDWLAKHGDSRSFLFVHGYDVHGQHALDPKVLEALPNSSTLTGSIEEQEAMREKMLLDRHDKAANQASLSEEDLDFLRAIYEAKVRLADEQLGVFLRGLADLGLAEKTLVAVISDHGEEFMEHGWLDHGTSLYQEQLHAVMVVRWPGQTQRHPVGQTVRTLDLFPTLFDALGLQAPSQVDGSSLLPLLQGQPWDEPVFAETDFRMFVNQRMIRRGGHKLILDLQDGSKELYDLVQDPGETQDLSSSEPGLAYEMEQALRHWMSEQPPP
jgi:arylsulfatase A-like enzyme